MAVKKVRYAGFGLNVWYSDVTKKDYATKEKGIEAEKQHGKTKPKTTKPKDTSSSSTVEKPD